MLSTEMEANHTPTQGLFKKNSKSSTISTFDEVKLNVKSAHPFGDNIVVEIIFRFFINLTLFVETAGSFRF